MLKPRATKDTTSTTEVIIQPALPTSVIHSQERRNLTLHIMVHKVWWAHPSARGSSRLSLRAAPHFPPQQKADFAPSAPCFIISPATPRLTPQGCHAGDHVLISGDRKT